MSLLRLARAFRVFRLFKRIKSLKKIIDSLGKAVPGVVNAFVVMIILMCIYAIVAVEFFREFGTDECPKIACNSTEMELMMVEGPAKEEALIQCREKGYTGGAEQCYYTEVAYWEGEKDDRAVDFLTARGFTYGFEYYGTFSKALFTLFQVLTGESWAEAVARPLVFGWSGFAAGIFFVSFIIINGIVLINVVVAVLLEKMVDDDEPKDEGVAATGEKSSAPGVANESTKKMSCNYGATGGSDPDGIGQLKRMVADQSEQITHLRTELAQIASFLHAYPPSPMWKAPASEGPSVITGVSAQAGDSTGSPKAVGGGPPRRSCQRLDA